MLESLGKKAPSYFRRVGDSGRLPLGLRRNCLGDSPAALGSGSIDTANLTR